MCCLWMVLKHMKYQPWPQTLHLSLKRAPRFRSIKYHLCFRSFATWTNQQHYQTSPYDIGWCFGGFVGIEQFWWRILDKNSIHSFHLCMISGNQDEAWPMYHVWPISERFMHGWFGGTWLACCHWLNTGPVSGRCPIMFVLTRPYQCDTCFFCSTLRKPAVSNLGQLLFCRSITRSRCRNAYRDLWIMTIVQLIHSIPIPANFVCSCHVLLLE